MLKDKNYEKMIKEQVDEVNKYIEELRPNEENKSVDIRLNEFVKANFKQYVVREDGVKDKININTIIPMLNKRITFKAKLRKKKTIAKKIDDMVKEINSKLKGADKLTASEIKRKEKQSKTEDANKEEVSKKIIDFGKFNDLYNTIKPTIPLSSMNTPKVIEISRVDTLAGHKEINEESSKLLKMLNDINLPKKNILEPVYTYIEGENKATQVKPSGPVDTVKAKYKENDSVVIPNNITSNESIAKKAKALSLKVNTKDMKQLTDSKTGSLKLSGSNGDEKASSFKANSGAHEFEQESKQKDIGNSTSRKGSGSIIPQKRDSKYKLINDTTNSSTTEFVNLLFDINRKEQEKNLQTKLST
jgi:hypothetical protein